MSEILLDQKGSLGIVTLNRPQALNSLSLEMIRGLAAALARWEVDDAITVVLIKGAGERAFCAGGDIKAVYSIGKDPQDRENKVDELFAFFAEEYELDKLIFHYKKPLISLMDGITMGGGFGVGGPCDFRIVTDKTLFAMPEVGIGLFPDVGSMHSLTRCPGEMGAYLAVTGNHIKAGDMIYGGLATHYKGDLDEGALISAVADNCADNDALAGVFEEICDEPPTGNLAAQQSFIDDCFGCDDVQDILQRLESSVDEAAQPVFDLLKTRSPLSMVVSLQHFKLSQGQSFDQIIARDFTLLRSFLKAPDFYEGVRAAVIDKDKAPQWVPSSLSEISETLLQDYFNENKKLCA